MPQANKTVKAPHNPLAIWISLTGLFTSSVFLSVGTDPFNLPKMFLLIIGASVLFFTLLNKLWSKTLEIDIFLTLAAAIFIAALISTTIFSGAPFSQQIYGVYGRNTGLLTEISLLVLLLATSTIRQVNACHLLLKSFLLAGFFNLAVGVLEIANLNPQKVGLTYSESLIGSFGNPNFFGAFLGIFGSLIWIKLISKSSNFKIKFFYLATLIVTILMIRESNARQGILILIFGIVLGSLIYLRFSELGNKVFFLAATFSGAAVLVSVLGMLQIGPLAKYLYKESVSLRGEYWAAGLNMFSSNIFTGTGLNSYGDWYRFSRRPSALILPGPEVTTNSAHNVFIDYLSGGGIFLFVGYLLIHIYAAYCAVKFLKKIDKFDPIFVSAFVGWVGYLAQSLISINQIGLSVWGWIFPGVVIAYSRIKGTLDVGVNPNRSIRVSNYSGGTSSKQAREDFRSPVFVFVGLLMGLLLAFPPQNADFNWRSTQTGTSADKLILAAKTWPRNEYRTSRTVASLYESNLNSEALDLALEGVRDFPRSSALWKMIYFLPNTPPSLRKEAKAQVNALDPNNKL